MEKVCGVYRIRNVKTGMFYIGGSARNIISRWGDHKRRLRNGQHKNTHFLNAWKKYGEDNFSFDIIWECRKEDVFKYEQVLIKMFWKIGLLYNLNDRAREPIIVNRKSVCSYRVPDKKFIKKYESLTAAERDTGASRSKISETCRGIYITTAGFYWAFDGEELVVRESIQGKRKNVKKPICYNKDKSEFKRFDSYSEAAKSFNGSCSTIVAACSGRARTAYGYFWACGDEKPHIYESSNCKKRVGKYKNGELIETFDSAAAASRDVSSTRLNISRICRRLSGDDYGFDWKYLD